MHEHECMHASRNVGDRHLRHAEGCCSLNVRLHLARSHRLAEEKRRPYKCGGSCNLRSSCGRRIIFQGEKGVGVDGNGASLRKVRVLPKILCLCLLQVSVSGNQSKRLANAQNTDSYQSCQTILTSARCASIRRGLLRKRRCQLRFFIFVKRHILEYTTSSRPHDTQGKSDLEVGIAPLLPFILD